MHVLAQMKPFERVVTLASSKQVKGRGGCFGWGGGETNLERPRLTSISIDSHILTLQGLDDKVGHNSSVVRVHSGTEGVEDSGDSDVDVVLAHEAVRESLNAHQF